MPSKRVASVLFLICLIVGGCTTAPTFDLVIQGGLVIDGTGRPGTTTNIAIHDGVIVEIGDLEVELGLRTIDATGLTVTPGFIDMMGGSSIPLLRDPDTARSKITQGITTVLVGEGGSVAPRHIEIGTGYEPTWQTFEEYFRLLEAKQIALNVVHNVGATQVRRLVVGEEDIQPTEQQLSEMRDLVEQAMQEGTVGLSTALIYPPGVYAETEEIIELAKVASRYDGVYFTHMRNESFQVLEAIDEALRIGKEADIPVHIYHLKAAGQENWPLMEQALQRIQEARDGGLSVTADIYPYIRNGIGLGSFIHPRHYAHGEETFVSTLGNKKLRDRLRREIESTSDWENWYRHVGQDWGNVLISRIGPGPSSQWVGMSIQEVAEKRAVDVWKAFFDLVQEGGVGVNPKSMNEEQKHQAMRAPFVCFDNDAAPTNPVSVASAHPRAFGAFPRVLAKYVREEQVIPLEEAIRRLTLLPAEILKLKNRGRIEVGYIADLALFDPEKIRDTATFTHPLSYSEGIEYLLVRGQFVIDQGEVTGSTPGKVIRHHN